VGIGCGVQWKMNSSGYESSALNYCKRSMAHTDFQPYIEIIKILGKYEIEIENV